MNSDNEDEISEITISIPASIKKEMESSYTDWNAVLLDAIGRELRSGTDLAEALALNERVRKSAPESWDSTQVIRYWRDARR
jgi:hypothetical protein